MSGTATRARPADAAAGRHDGTPVLVSVNVGPLPPVNPGVTGQAARVPHQPPGAAGTGPLVTFARSGISTRLPDGTGNVLGLAEACDFPARWSCRTGVCHTCATPLLSSEITYAPDPLEPPGQGQVLICCSQPSTDIVLDM